MTKKSNVFQAVNQANEVASISSSELGKTIEIEVVRAAKNKAFALGNSHDQIETIKNDIIGEVMADTYIQIMNHPQYWNLAGIRSTINLCIKNWSKGQARFNNQVNFSTFEKTNEDGETTSLDMEQCNDMEDQIAASSDVSAFIATLTDRQRQILELNAAGYGNNEICSMLNVSINTPKNTMKTIKKLAEDFGLSLPL